MGSYGLFLSGDVLSLLITLVLFRRQFHNLDRFATALGCLSAGFAFDLCYIALACGDRFARVVFAFLTRFVFKFTLLRFGVFFSLGMTIWLAFEYGFTRSRPGFVCGLGWLLCARNCDTRRVRPYVSNVLLLLSR